MKAVKIMSPAANMRFQLPELSIPLRNVETSPKLIATSSSLRQSPENNQYVNALHKAILDGRLTQLKYFLEMGTSPKSIDKKACASPSSSTSSCLMLACLVDQVDYGVKVARILLSYGADLNTTDNLGRTVLYTACTQGRSKIFELFMNDENSLNVDLRHKDNDGNILLNHVCAFGTSRMVELVSKKMVERNVECDQRNNLGYTGLLLAIKNDQFTNALTLMKCCTNLSVSIRDREKCMNAIEWLESRIEALRERLESELDTHFRYCNVELNEISRVSARTRTTATTTNTTAKLSPYSRSSSKSRFSTKLEESRPSSESIEELHHSIYARMMSSSSSSSTGVVRTILSSTLELESMRQTPKLLRLLTAQRNRQLNELLLPTSSSSSASSSSEDATSAKHLVHVLFELYDDGSNRFKPSKQRAVNTTKAAKFKRNSIARMNRNSIVSLSQRLRVNLD